MIPYIIIAILAFGILIATHELGHFAAAKLCGVKVNEFSIGMGPAIVKKQRGETIYALRWIPLGGYCAMEGEDDSTDDPRAFGKQPALHQMIILLAGAAMNFLVGFIVMAVIFSGSVAFVSNTVAETVEGFKYGGENGILAGDEIISVNGARLFDANDFTMLIARGNGNSTVKLRRGGEKITIENYGIKPEYYTENGEEVYRYGISFGIVQADGWQKVKYAFLSCCNFVNYVRFGLTDLFTGVVSVKELTGPVGIVTMMTETGQASETARDAALNISYLCAFIAVNLAVMNLLPVPGLDGGRLFLLLVNVILEKLFRRRMSQRVEGYVNAVGLVLLMGLMVYVMFNDVVRLVR